MCDRIFIFPCTYEYIHRTDQVRPCTYLDMFWNPSTKSLVLGWQSAVPVRTWYVTIWIQYYLVLLYFSTYYLVQRFTILRKSTFRSGTRYVMPLHQAGRCAAAYVPSTRSKSRFPQDREPLYKVVGTGTEQYKAVLYSDRYVLIQHSDIPSTSGICGKFP